MLASPQALIQDANVRCFRQREHIAAGDLRRAASSDVITITMSGTR